MTFTTAYGDEQKLLSPFFREIRVDCGTRLCNFHWTYERYSFSGTTMSTIDKMMMDAHATMVLRRLWYDKKGSARSALTYR